MSDGGEADFQTQPPTLITYPRFFSFYFDYIYIKDGWSRLFFSRGGTVSGSIGSKETPQANPYGVILTVYMVI